MGNLKFGYNTPQGAYFGYASASSIYCGYNQVYSGGTPPVPPVPPSVLDYLCFDIVSGGTIVWKDYGYSYSGRYVEYSTDSGETWETATPDVDGTTINVNAGDKVYFKGDIGGSAHGSSVSDRTTFSDSTAYFNLSGYLMSLVAVSDDYHSAVLDPNSTYSFRYLFAGTNVIDASALILPSSITTNYEFQQLFGGCAHLTATPVISGFASVNNSSCMAGMFSGCTSLQSVELPSAAPVGTSCYANMFRDCSSLSYIKCLTTAPDTQTMSNWVAGVASEGRFEKNSSTTWNRGANAIPATWFIVGQIEVHPTSLSFDATGGSETISVTSGRDYAITPDVDWITGLPAYGYSGTSAFTATAQANTGDSRTGHITFNALTYSYTVNVSQGGGTPPGPAYDEMYMTFDILSGGTIVFSKTGNGNDLAIEYDFSDDNWQSVWASDAASINVSAGDKVRFRGNNATYSPQSLNYWCSFTSGTCEFNVYGNIMSMINGDNFIGTTVSGTRALAHLFEGCAGIRSAEHLILPDNVATGCYNSMFKDCINLTTAPELPATSVTYQNCYANMFYGCTSLDYIKCYAQVINSNTTTNWVLGVAANGTFWADINASWSTGDSGIPNDWDVEYI